MPIVDVPPFPLRPGSLTRSRKALAALAVGRLLLRAALLLVLCGVLLALVRPAAAQGLRQSHVKPSFKPSPFKPAFKPRLPAAGGLAIRIPDGPRKPGTDRPRPPKDHGGRPRRPRPPAIVIFPPLGPGGGGVEIEDVPRRAERPRRPPAAGQPQAVPRQVLIVVGRSEPAELSNEIARTHGLSRRESQDMVLMDGRCELYDIRGRRSTAQVLAALRRDPRVRLVQPNFLYRAQQATSASTAPPALPQYALDRIALPQAHELARGRDVVVAVIDSGVDATHPDLQGAVTGAFDAVGLPDKAPGFHGTAVAGIIRAQGVVAGAAPQASILAVRAFRVRSAREAAETTSWTLLRAIEWAVENKANVLNLSFAGPKDDAVHHTLQGAAARRVIAVAAAGNNGPKAAPVYPAAYPEVIAVTAVDERDRRYAQANRGSYIAVAAPGVDVLAPVEKGKHSYLSGTSFATAYVSGIVALLLERNRDLDTKAVTDLIAAGAEDLGPRGHDEDFGAGLVNALASLKAMERMSGGKH